MVTQATLVLLYLRRMRSSDPFRRTITGISVETGIPYSGVHRILEGLAAQGLVESPDLVGFSRRKSEVYRLTKEGEGTTVRRMEELREEVVRVEGGNEALSSLTLADALVNPPAWFPLRANDLAEHLKKSARITAEDLAYWRSFAALHHVLLQAAARRFGERIVLEPRKLADSADGPALVTEALRQLKQAGVLEFEGKGVRSGSPIVVRIGRPSYLQWLARNAKALPAPPRKASAKEAPRAPRPLRYPELCEAARRWVSARAGADFGSLRVVTRPEDAHGEVVLEDRRTGARHTVRYGPDGRIEGAVGRSET